ncbi:MAG: AMP-binding protein [bacterium]|nr:AMP-binding protein [bacterium]
MDNIIYRLLEHRKNIPDKTAIVYRNRPVSYRQLFEDTLITAGWLRENQFEAGDGILVFVPMSYNLYRLLLAVFYIGATAVFVDAWADKKRMAQAVEITRPRGFVGSLKAQLLRVISPPIRSVPIKLAMWDNPFSRCRMLSMDSFDPACASGDDTALITFTTGSTGTPKAARRTHRFLWTQHLVLSGHLSIEPDDIDLATLPVFVLNNLALGVTSVIPDFNPAKPADINPRVIVEQINRWKITTSAGSPAFYEKLADHVESEQIRLPLRRLYVGGAPVFPSLARRFLKAFPETGVTILYGSTESEPISGIEALEVAESDVSRGLMVGRKVDEIDVAVIEPHDGPVSLESGKTIADYCVPNGEAGEIVVAGDHVLTEYVNSPESFRQNKIVDGGRIWHRTGDGGSIDNDGCISLFGRIKNRIQHGDYDIFTLPIEQKLMELDEVTCSAVIEIDGQLNVVVESDSDTRDKVLGVLNSMRLPLENPRVTALEHIPRDPRHHSKVDYGKLQVIMRA